MVNYWTPVFTLSKDEGTQEGDFQRIDAYEEVNDEGEYDGVLVYRWEEGPSQMLDRVEVDEPLEPNRLEVEFPVEYEKIVEWDDALRAAGLDRDKGINDIDQNDAANSTYRVEVYDGRGVIEDMTRWNGTIPDQREFHEVFREIRSLSREQLFESNDDISLQALED
mgnify:FL=1